VATFSVLLFPPKSSFVKNYDYGLKDDYFAYLKDYFDY
jgi:hypothetical protein